MKDTDKVTLTLGQIKKLVKESKSSKRILKETAAGDDIISDLAERAKLIIDDGEDDKSKAVMEAINDGLIYTKDIYDLLEHYNTIKNETIIESYYEELFNDVLAKVDDSLDN